MSKDFFKNYLPDPETLKNHKNLQFLGDRLHQENLWHLNRRSITRAFAIGLFCAWIPTPTQMAIAAVCALFFSANLPLSVALVWLTNPITMPPLFYFAYRVGLILMNRPSPSSNFEFSLDGLFSGLGDIWEPFLLGCLVMGIGCSLIAYHGANFFWRQRVRKLWLHRQCLRVGIAPPPDKNLLEEARARLEYYVIKRSAADALRVKIAQLTIVYLCMLLDIWKLSGLGRIDYGGLSLKAFHLGKAGWDISCRSAIKLYKTIKQLA